MLIKAKLRKSFVNVSIIFKTIRELDVLIVFSTMNSRKNVDTRYNFRKWNYACVRIALSLDINAQFVCLDTKSRIVLIDRNFFKTQFNASIRKMTSSIFVCDLEIAKHMLNKYVIVSLYFLSKNKNENVVITKIIRKVYFVDNFKANMLIKNNLLDLERITIDVAWKFAYIKSYDIIMKIEIKTTRTIVYERVHSRKTIDVSLRSKMTISIHYIVISIDRNFLFESNNTNLSLYAHIINVKITSILIKNDNDKTIYVLRNCRLDRIFEFDFSNAF